MSIGVPSASLVMPFDSTLACSVGMPMSRLIVVSMTLLLNVTVPYIDVPLRSG